ncbi:MAG: DoxX family protein [Salinigranum sp.]
MSVVPSLSRETESDERASAGASASGSASEARSNAPPLVARLLYGGVLAFTGLNHFRNTEGMVGYVESKGVPEAGLAVPLTGAMLVASGLGIALWRLPRLAAATAAAFFVAVTPTMHDFWNAEGDERGDQRNNFLKNAAMLGAAVAFLSRGEDG